ncbi:hypothetical protein V1512DRAFT_268460 [Lipomyces arxii]|uniref:uncharacterized protein n=1 Tax=Lipomyces arxii TaxID=56418 RepID=UPI0034CDD2B9
MRVLVAAEDSGSIKDISFSAGTNTSLQPNAEVAIETFASAGRAGYVQRMTTVKLQSGKEYICIARKGGIVQLYDIEAPHTLYVEWKDKTQRGEDAFVGLEYVGGILSSCTSTGRMVMRDLDTEEMLPFHASLEDPVNAFRVHPRQANVIAYGGKERELEIDIIDNVDEDENVWRMPLTDNNALSRRKLWKSKNVKNDELNLRVPVWISDIRFIDLGRDHSDTDFRVVVSTRFGHIRVYETKLSRKPILNVEVGDHPLVALSGYVHDREIVYCDTHSTTARFDLITGKQTGHYSGSAGAILCLDSFTGIDRSGQPISYLATGGLDRFLRVYDLQTRALVSKVFVGAKLNQVRIVSGIDANKKKRKAIDSGDQDETKRHEFESVSPTQSDDDNEDNEDEEDEEEDKDIWNKLEQADEEDQDN